MRVRSSDQEDFLLRLIREAAEAIRRCREMLTHSASAAPSVRVDAAIAMDRLLGSESSVLQRVDAESAVQLLGDDARLALWLDALRLDADACDAMGETAEADRIRERAHALRAASDKSITGSRARAN